MSAELAAQGWEKLLVDLAWRGPNGKKQNFVSLPRELAEAMLADKIEQGRKP